MPQWWSDKEEKMYRHVLANYSGPRAREIAARTVNRFHGEHKHGGAGAKSAVESHMRKRQPPAKPNGPGG
jgi:hypothetical protein